MITIEQLKQIKDKNKPTLDLRLSEIGAKEIVEMD